MRHRRQQSNHMCPIKHPSNASRIPWIVYDDEATMELKADTVRYFKENEEVKMPGKKKPLVSPFDG